MNFINVIAIGLLVVICGSVRAEPGEHQQIEREAKAFLDRYLGVYNRRFGHPERGEQFRRELEALVHMPLMLSPPAGRPWVPDSLAAFSKNFEGFVRMLEGKNVARLEWNNVELHVLTPNKVLANNVGHGLTANGELAYETTSLYLLYRDDHSWKITLFSPYHMENALRLEGP